MNVDFLFYMQNTHVEVWYFFQCGAGHFKRYNVCEEMTFFWTVV